MKPEEAVLPECLKTELGKYLEKYMKWDG